MLTKPNSRYLQGECQRVKIGSYVQSHNHIITKGWYLKTRRYRESPGTTALSSSNGEGSLVKGWGQSSIEQLHQDSLWSVSGKEQKQFAYLGQKWTACFLSTDPLLRCEIEFVFKAASLFVSPPLCCWYLL